MPNFEPTRATATVSNDGSILVAHPGVVHRVKCMGVDHVPCLILPAWRPIAECLPEWKDGRRLLARFDGYWREVAWGPKGLKWMYDRGGFYLADKATHVMLPPPSPEEANHG